MLAVEGNISTNNFIVFSTAEHPQIAFSPRFLYLQAYTPAGKSFCLQISFTLSTKPYRTIYSSLYRVPKRHSDSLLHMPLPLLPGKWNLAVLDLYSLAPHFGLQPQELKLTFRLTALEVRAHSRLRGIFHSDRLYSPDSLPKELALPLHHNLDFFQKYHYLLDSIDSQFTP